jgi:coenzyme Q-binding protein COQ10
MASHHEQRRLDYSPQQLFELVAHAERYPEFLPLWNNVQVSKIQQNQSAQQVYFTDQTIQLGPVYKRFSTQTTLIPFESIHVVSFDPMFKKFTINWIFTADQQGGCKLHFSLDCIATSVFIRPVIDITLLQAAQSIITAFENRAKVIYGSIN